jgi:soluble lytic murein transglycosylase-like protein
MINEQVIGVRAHVTHHAARFMACLLAFALLASGSRVVHAQRRPSETVYDDAFRKYSKRYFGPGFDWRVFKAQGMAESGLDSTARSRVGARGIMQLMPSTFSEIASHNPNMTRIDDPQWNIAAGILFDRDLWRSWEQDSVNENRLQFMFGSYNAGRGTIHKAQMIARGAQLDHRSWQSIESVAPKVTPWRYRETLEYVRKIDWNLMRMDDRGRFTTSALPFGSVK